MNIEAGQNIEAGRNMEAEHKNAGFGLVTRFRAAIGWQMSHEDR